MYYKACQINLAGLQIQSNTSQIRFTFKWAFAPLAPAILTSNKNSLPMPIFQRIITLSLCLAISACTLWEIDSSNHFSGNGRDTRLKKQRDLYQESMAWPVWSTPSPELQTGLDHQLSYLARPSVPETHTLGNLNVTNEQLRESVERLKAWLANPESDPLLSLYQLAGADRRGNLQYTGYYVPVMQVRREPDEIFKYPLYRRPAPEQFDGELPSREAIDFEGALAGQGLEIAYSASLIDNFFLQVQGSGMVTFGDGSEALLSWGGGNGHSYRSLGKILINQGEIPKEKISASAIKAWLLNNPDRQRDILSENPSYLFFSETDGAPVGAANVPLTAGHSIAVDPEVIPLGSVLLGLVPLLDEHGELIRHEYRFLLAQDKGAAINGSGHVDVYYGIGDEAKKKANALKQFGRIWLLLPAER